MENKSSLPRKTYQRSVRQKIPVTTLRSGNLPVEYESVCRLCLEKPEPMFEIFKDDSIVPILVKIKSVLDLKVEEEDELPTLICANCLLGLNEFYNFKKRCIASDVKLRQCLLKTLPKPQLPTLNGSDNSLCLDPLVSKLQKNDCTIHWDDQVPLAGIIYTKYEYDKKRSSERKTPPQYIPELLKVEDGDLTEGHVASDQVNTVPREYEVIDSATSDPSVNVRFYEQVEKDSAIFEDDYDEMPLAQRLSLEEKNYNKSRRKKSKKIANLRIRCGRCNKLMPALTACREHRKYCTFEYKCSQCFKTFISYSTLKRHYRMHTGERPFTCRFCDHAFTQKETLHRHILQIHTSIKPYKCQYCDKGFALSYILTAHLKSVHTIRPKYRCAHCPKVFTHASGLSRHKNFHNGAQYPCKVCYRKFTDPSSVKRHLKAVHTKELLYS